MPGENELVRRPRWRIGWDPVCDWYVIGPWRISASTLYRWHPAMLRARWRWWRRRAARRELYLLQDAYYAGYQSGRGIGQREGRRMTLEQLRAMLRR